MLCLDGALHADASPVRSDPHEFVKVFSKRIKHIHCKDMSAEMEFRRGMMLGCVMAVIPLGDGVVCIEQLVKEPADIGFDGLTNLEIAGSEAVKKSAERLRAWSP